MIFSCNIFKYEEENENDKEIRENKMWEIWENMEDMGEKENLREINERLIELKEIIGENINYIYYKKLEEYIFNCEEENTIVLEYYIIKSGFNRSGSLD